MDQHSKQLNIRMLFGGMVLALAILACNLPASRDSSPQTPTEASSPTQAAEATSVPSGNCPAVDLAPKPSGVIVGVTMAEGTEGDGRDPVNPTTTFATSATIHAVAKISDAPANTTLKAIWYAYDTSGAVDCNYQIDSYELSTDGSRNVDFSLSPKTSWPAGSYRVEIFMNGTLDQVATFTVK